MPSNTSVSTSFKKKNELVDSYVKSGNCSLKKKMLLFMLALTRLPRKHSVYEQQDKDTCLYVELMDNTDLRMKIPKIFLLH